MIVGRGLGDWLDDWGSGSGGAGNGSNGSNWDPSWFDELAKSGAWSSAGSSSSSPDYFKWFQAINNDVFGFAKLFNPVPAGTVMQVGPNGTYIARAQNGQPTPGVSNLLGAGGGMGMGTLLTIGGVLVGGALLVHAFGGGK